MNGMEGEPGVMDPMEEGVVLFNEGKFWHAHEAWERIWLQAEGEQKIYLQGLIQLAAAYHHAMRGTFRGGVRLFDAALLKLEGFPPAYGGVDRAEVVAAAVRDREKIAHGQQIDPDHLPKLRYN